MSFLDYYKIPLSFSFCGYEVSIYMNQPSPVPVVWSVDGPVPIESVEPCSRFQLKSPLNQFKS